MLINTDICTWIFGAYSTDNQDAQCLADVQWADQGVVSFSSLRESIQALMLSKEYQAAHRHYFLHQDEQEYHVTGSSARRDGWNYGVCAHACAFNVASRPLDCSPEPGLCMQVATISRTKALQEFLGSHFLSGFAVAMFENSMVNSY